MVQKIVIYGYNVKYEKDDNVSRGIQYLRDDLEKEEARVFFDQAKMKGAAQFETDNDEEYTLMYSTDGFYTLLRRPEPSAFF